MAARYLPGVDDQVDTSFDSIGQKIYPTSQEFITAIDIGCKYVIEGVKEILQHALHESGQCQELSVPLYSLREHFEQIITLCELLQALCESALQTSELHRTNTLHKIKALAPKVEKHFRVVWKMMLESESIVHTIKQLPGFQEKLKALKEMATTSNHDAVTSAGNDTVPSWESLGLTLPIIHHETERESMQPSSQDQQQHAIRHRQRRAGRPRHQEQQTQAQNGEQQPAGSRQSNNNPPRPDHDSFLAKLYVYFIDCSKAFIKWLTIGYVQY